MDHAARTRPDAIPPGRNAVVAMKDDGEQETVDRERARDDEDCGTKEAGSSDVGTPRLSGACYAEMARGPVLPGFGDRAPQVEPEGGSDPDVVMRERGSGHQRSQKN